MSVYRFTWTVENNPNEDDWHRERFPSVDHEPKLRADWYGEDLYVACVCGQWKDELDGDEYLTTLLERYAQHVREATS